MARGVYSGKVLEWSTTSWKPMSSALIGLVPEPSHDLREGIRSGTGSDWTRGTYTTLTCGGSVRKPLRSRRRHRDWPDVLPVFYGDQTTRVFSTIRDFFLILRVTSQVNDFNKRPILLIVRRTWDQRRRCHRRSCIGQPRAFGHNRSFNITILGAIPLA